MLMGNHVNIEDKEYLQLNVKVLNEFASVIGKALIDGQISTSQLLGEKVSLEIFQNKDKFLGNLWKCQEC